MNRWDEIDEEQDAGGNERSDVYFFPSHLPS